MAMNSPIRASVALQPGPWPVLDPFLFCVHHDDAYPRSDGAFGPAGGTGGRELGNDFSRREGWSLYHGHPVPGFPAHPHRGFETITVVRRGRVDHADSLGAAARYGDGDVQWLTAGRGIVHAEMFPLLSAAEPNPLDLFQIWLNLPAARKMCEPRFVMFWADRIPKLVRDGVELTVVAGAPVALDLGMPLAPPPDSWAAQADADVAVWTLRLSPGACIALPPAAGAQTRRVLYALRTEGLKVAGQRVDCPTAFEVDAASPVLLEATAAAACELLLLQGRPIGEPVAQHGPFVMNRREELVQAFEDYQRTRFGGWPWPSEAPVHGADAARFSQVAGVREMPAGS
jgi:redox-sensitive bicupin YhaK (pirin superfamily)